MDILKWVKFSNQWPPEPKNDVESHNPVMIGINTEIDGLLVDLVYWEWQTWGKKWELNYDISFIYDCYNYELKDLSWFPYPLPELEIEEEV